MYVCLCNAVTDRAVREAADAGAQTLADLAAMTGCATTCGACAQVAMEMLREIRPQSFPLAIFAAN